MKPELILQSDVLDIVFENKNKEYGAYELRRHYNNRLTKSFVTMAVGVLVFTVLQGLNMQHKSNSFLLSGPDTLKLVEVQINKEVEEQKKELPKRLHKENVSQASVTSVVVVPDDKADKPMSDIAKIDSSLIGTTEKSGNAFSGNVGETSLASNNPNGNIGGKEIEKAELPAAAMEKAELMPQFPGGMEAFLKFMRKNLREPDDMENAQKLVVIAKFVVDAEGNIVDINIIKNGRDDLDAEVLRVIRKMPKWKPGMQNGQRVPVYFKLPVTFVGSE